MNVTDKNVIRNILLEAHEQTDGDFTYQLDSEEFYWPEHRLLFPENWSWEFVEVANSIDYDSYGYGYSNGAYIIFKVSDGEQEQLYRIPGSYASYEGWDWDLGGVTKTAKTEKTILVWSSVD